MIITATDWDSQRWPNYSAGEVSCSHTGELRMEDFFLDFLQQLRRAVNRPVTITSGYRAPTHPVELTKASPGTGSHCHGLAADISCSGAYALQLLSKALQITADLGCGVKQHGGYGRRFLHFDLAPPDDNGRPRPHIWSYA